MMIWDIYSALMADELISEKAGNNIKFYEYPEAKDVKETHIIIDPLSAPKPSDYADDKWLTDDYMYQIDVWSKDLQEASLIADRIRRVMWRLNFRQTDGIDEYDNDFKIFRDARRYRGKKYRSDING